MKLIEVVNAYLAADEMSRETWPYAVALAVVKVKRAVKDEVDFFLGMERELVGKYADTDERGNIRMTAPTRFAFKDPAAAADYERERRELEQTEVAPTWTTMRVKAPEAIKPAALEALAGFIEFVGEGEPL